MPIIVNKVGAHRNGDALSRVVYYMMTSNYFKAGNCRGVWEYSPSGIVNGFEFVKEMYGKSDGKQVSHLVIGTKREGLIEKELIGAGESALDYLYGDGFQCCYVFHRGSDEDPGYLHLHMAVNTVNFQDGRRFYETYNAVTGLRNYLAALYNSWQWSTAYDDSCVWEE